jgi:glycosyltransferase involved in cell wall biosynthesis
MKIAYVYDAVYPWIKGGAEKRIYELAKRLVLRGHEVHWYSLGWWWPEEGQKDIEIDGIRLHGVYKPIELYDGQRRSIKEAIYFALMLFPQLRGQNFDIIDCQGFPFFPGFTAKINSLFGKSILVLTLHEVWDDYWYEYLGKAGIFGKLTEKAMIHLTDKIIAVSPKTKKDLKKIYSAEKSVIIPNGIDFEEIMRINSSMDKSDVIFAGRLIKEKNVHLLFKSLVLVKKVIPDIKCLVIGDGPERHRLERLSVNLNLAQNLRFLGFLEDQNDLISYMKSSKIFVLPSKREGFGMVVLEANACGLPVVVVDYPMNAAVDLIEHHKNGFISEPSEEALAHNIIKGIKEKNTMENSCVDFARGYDWDEIVHNLEDFYQNLSGSG